jgi:hypothetical protein
MGMGKRSLFAGCLVLVIAAAASAQFTLTQTDVDQVGGTSGPPDAADVAVLDLDGDGNQDIVTYNSEGGSAPSPRADFLAILLGNGDGTFAPPVETGETGFTRFGGQTQQRSRLMTGEFSGDGLLDVVVTNQDTQQVALFVSDGAGSFAAPTLYDSGHAASSLHVGDFDGDGQDDVLVLSKAAYRLVFLAGKGDGTLADPVDQPSDLISTHEPVDFDVGDLDLDGNLDALAPNLKDEDLVDVNQAIGFLGKGDGTFEMTAPYVIDTGSTDVFENPVYCRIGDLDADGFQDLAVADFDPASPTGRNVHVAYGTEGNWEPAIGIEMSWKSFVELDLTDLDGDGRLDIAASCDGPMGYQVLLNDGARGFVRQDFVQFTTMAGMFSILGADVTNDGKTDLILGTQYTGHVIVYRNDSTSAIASDFVRGDVNADGKSDISDPVFTLGYFFIGGDSPTCLDAADANDDGGLDLSDPIHLLQGLFGGAGSPPPPYPDCGADPTADDLGCAAFSRCP